MARSNDSCCLQLILTFFASCELLVYDKLQEAVLTHLAEVGPLAVNVDASQWHSYTGTQLLTATQVLDTAT